MSTETTNYNLVKPADNETADIAVINENLDLIDQALTPSADPAQVPHSNGPYTLSRWVSVIANRLAAWLGDGLNWWATPPITLTTTKNHIDAASPHSGHALTSDLTTHLADYTLQVPFSGATTNVGNAYTIATPAIDTLAAGMAVCVKINADSTGAATLNWNGKGAKSIKKANGTDVTNLKANGIYTLRYDGANFILQGEGASGNATASDLLSGKTATTDAGEITGTLALTGNVTAATLLAGITAYGTDPKTKITGTMPNNGAYNITPQTYPVAIPAGYHNGGGIVAAYTLGAVLKSVQKGSINIDSGGVVQYIPIAPVDLSKSFLIISRRVSDVSGFMASLQANRIYFYCPSGQLNETEWTVVEFLSGISVQRGIREYSSAGTIYTANISQVDLARSFAIAYLALPNVISGDMTNNFVTRLTSSTTLTVEWRAAKQYGVGWEVISFL